MACHWRAPAPSDTWKAWPIPRDDVLDLPSSMAPALSATNTSSSTPIVQLATLFDQFVAAGFHGDQAGLAISLRHRKRKAASRS